MYEITSVFSDGSSDVIRDVCKVLRDNVSSRCSWIGDFSMALLTCFSNKIVKVLWEVEAVSVVTGEVMGYHDPQSSTEDETAEVSPFCNFLNKIFVHYLS